VILLDAGALVSFLAGEPAASEVRRILAAGDAAIPAPNLAEAIDVLVRVFGNDLGQVEAALVPLIVTRLPVVPVGEAEARRGAAVRIAHYHRQRSPLSLADCLLLGTAGALGAGVATTDPPVARAARAEGLRVVALPDSTGSRP